MLSTDTLIHRENGSHPSLFITEQYLDDRFSLEKDRWLFERLVYNITAQNSHSFDILIHHCQALL